MPYTLLFLVVFQCLFPVLIPSKLVYSGRLSFEYFRDNHADLDLAIREIKEEIARKNLDDYVIILGDSVAYSARCSAEESIGAYLEAASREAGHPLRVFTLAEPSMQIGDIYTVVLKLHAAGIRTPRLVANLLYGGFVARTPFPPAVFWLEDDLRRLDPEAYDRVRAHLEAARLDPLAKPPKTLSARFDRWASQHLYPLFAPLAYRDFIYAAWTRLVTGEDPKAEAVDPRVWTEKPHLPSTLKQAEYQQAFSDQPFDLTEANLEIYFLDRLLAATEGDQVVLFLSPVNQVLMRDNVSKPGYQDNIKRVDAWFASRGALPAAATGAATGCPPTGTPAGLIYLNLEHAVPDGYFADHLHLTPEGNRYLAELLRAAMERPGDRASAGGAGGVPADAGGRH